MDALPLPPATDLDLPDGDRLRVELTVSCRDADGLPKVVDAGELRDEHGFRVQVMHEGTRVVAGAYHGAWMTEIIRRLRGHHEPQEELVVHHILERLRAERETRRTVVVELGCFWAYYAIWAMRATGGRALLVEPDPGNLKVGRANVRLNRLDATFMQAAVGGAQGDMTRFVCESDNVEREVPVVTVPGLMAEHRLEQIDLLHLDVQGAETDVLSRALNTASGRRVRFLVVSTHHHSISGDPLTHQRSLALLKQAGAHIIAEHTVGESFSGDGLIAASIDPRDRDLVVGISRCRYRDSLFGELEPELGGTRPTDNCDAPASPLETRPSRRIRGEGSAA